MAQAQPDPALPPRSVSRTMASFSNSVYAAAGRRAGRPTGASSATDLRKMSGPRTLIFVVS